MKEQLLRKIEKLQNELNITRAELEKTKLAYEKLKYLTSSISTYKRLISLKQEVKGENKK